MFDRNLLKLPGMTGVLGALAILALLQAAAVIGQAYALSTAISQLWEGAPVEQATPPLAAFFICFTVMQVIRFAQETMLDRFSQARAEALRNQVIEQVFDKRTMLAMHQGSTLVAALATDGIDEVQSYLRIIPPKIIGMAALSIPILICEFVIDWPSGIILAVMFPVIMFFLVLVVISLIQVSINKRKEIDM